MMSIQEQEIRKELINAIEKVFESPVLGNLNCWYGSNQIERMSDAALAVLMATKEAQEFIKNEGVEPF